VPRRLVTTEDQADDLGADLDIGQTVTVDLGEQQTGHEIVGTLVADTPLADQVVDVRSELGMASAETLAPLGAIFVDVLAPHDVVGPSSEQRPVLAGYPDHVRDDIDRDRRREVLDHLAVAALQERFEVFVGELAHERLDAHGFVMGDDGVDDATDLAVARLGHLAHELLFFGHHHTRFAIARAEGVDVFYTGHDVTMAGEEPTDRYLRYRARRPQRAVRVVRDVGIDLEGIELDDAHVRPVPDALSRALIWSVACGTSGSLRVASEPNVP
jgi:hypothetical protein